MRICVIGGVTSTLATVEKLVEHGFRPAIVYGHSPADPSTKAGHVDLSQICKAEGIPHIPFRSIGDHEATICSEAYDLVFVVGFSQIVGDDLIRSARLGCIGFHPTYLPRGRGRAALAWLVLEESEGAATFFEIEPDMPVDSGPILAQAVFEIDAEDTAESVEGKVLENIRVALDDLLPTLDHWPVDRHPQDESLATEYGIRKPLDGFVDWRDDHKAIHALVRAATRPHPGAFTFVGERRIEILSSALPNPQPRLRGVVGKILRVDAGIHTVQCGTGLLDVEFDESRSVGTQLGYGHPSEMHELFVRVSKLESLLAPDLSPSAVAREDMKVE